MDRPVFLDDAALKEVFDLAALIDWMDTAHREPRPETVDALLGPPSSQYFVRSAASATAFGSKLVTIVPANPSQGRPSVQALFAVFDRETGVCRGVLDATSLTYWKTAADSALGSRHLSRPDSSTLLICGAGGLAPWLVRAHAVARPPLRRVLIWNRTGGKAKALAAMLQAEGLAAEPIDDLQAGIAEADIVSTATLTREPIIHGAWLRPGQHLDLVGAYLPDTREADDGCIRRSDVYVDYRVSARDVGDIHVPLQTGVLRESSILGDLYDLAHHNRQRSPEAITLYKNAGGAHLDLMTAEYLLQAANAR